MKENYKYSWLEKTHQKWKLIFFVILMSSVLLLILLEVFTMNNILKIPGLGRIEWTFIEIGLGFVSLFWFGLSVKCPYCGHKPVWLTIKSMPANEWLSSLTDLENCPKCYR